MEFGAAGLGGETLPMWNDLELLALEMKPYQCEIVWTNACVFYAGSVSASSLHFLQLYDAVDSH